MQVNNRGINSNTELKQISGIKNAKYYNYNFLNSNKTQDCFSYSADKNTPNLINKYKEIQKKQGLIGKTWDGIKNLFNMKSGSKHIEKVIKLAQSGQISQEEAFSALEKYEEGQKICVDVAADITSGIIAAGAFALAVPTGGASLAAGLGFATLFGAGTKIGIKAGDAALTGKNYNAKDLLYDCATGGINGLLAPVTNGLGNCVTKTIGKKLGLTIIQEGSEQAASQIIKQGLSQSVKTAVLTQSVDVAGGTIAKRALALGAGMAFDGALGGAADNMVRASLNGENVLEAGVQGAVGGAIMSPIIGSGFRAAGKAGRAVNNKITIRKVLPDGINTKFKQGNIGDCALLSTLDGMMNNPACAKTLRKSITKTIGGDYNVKIGSTIVKVSKSSLSDEVLSDTTGIRIFEQAYKQLSGNLDGGFAEVVAKQFGLNPIHIASDSINDELLNKLAKSKGQAVLSFGTLVDLDGTISKSGKQRHYFTIKNIDPDSKIVTLTSPIDTSKAIKLSYDDIKAAGISIDGGTTHKLDLPNSARSQSDIKFKGIAESAPQNENYWEESPYMDAIRYRIYEKAGAYELIDDAPYRIQSAKVSRELSNTIPFNYNNIQDLYIQNLTLATNKKGVRGSSIFAKNNKRYISELKKNGLDRIIDLRAESNIERSSQLCNNNGLEYTFFPIFYDKKLTPEQIITTKTSLPEFLQAMDKGKFYIGCSEGTNRTDVAFGLNYLLNPNEKTIPIFESKTPQKSLQMIMQLISCILDRDKSKQYHISEEFIQKLGWKDAGSFLAEFEKRVKRLNFSNIPK